ncbi:thioredoxin TrxA [Penicillium taxi]|uniref:thioredoxin TrxA n=1 Tax=Penicillium taxi TaxID=168475 RepID=UPI0025458D52|nr:thioredoxin TrxA [Penicillium taxi]KAJ5885170.1 thioredoxin TrxA [Penicillium taxi]
MADSVQIVKGKPAFFDLISSEQLVVVEAFAIWCGPCNAISPKVEAWSHKYPDVKFAKFDVDEEEDLAQELGIRAMPSFYFFKGDEKIADYVGADANEIENLIREHK